MLTINNSIIKRHFTALQHKRQKLIILGSGYAGFTFAKNLNKSIFDVTLISPRNHFLFTPLLPSTTVGTLEFRAVQEPIRTIPDLSFRHAMCTDIDFDQKQLTYEDVFKKKPYNISYDTLVISTGSTTNTFNTPGVSEANHVYFLKQLWDARKIRNRLLECFERAVDPNISKSEQERLLTFLVVGGGPISIEFAGELEHFIKSDIRVWYPDITNLVKVMVVEGSPDILGGFDRDLGLWAKKRLEKTGLIFKTGQVIKKITMDENGKTEAHSTTGEVIPYGLCVWSTGIKQVPLIEGLDLEKDRTGRIYTDGKLRVKNRDFVYAMGDCSMDPGNALPCLAQVANQQAIYLGKTFNNYHNRMDSPVNYENVVPDFHYKHKGMMTNLGNYGAIIDTRRAGENNVPGRGD